LNWKTGPQPQAAEKKADRWRLETIEGTEFITSAEDCIIWLGHATFFIRLGGITLLTDPVFYPLSGLVKRLSTLPCAVSDLRGIDYVLLSHAHRDHCDQRSLRELYRHNSYRLLTGLQIGKLVSGWLPQLEYQEAGWYQQYRSLPAGLTITYLPTQHWSNRFPWDTNETLWGSMMIQMGGKSIFFGGDSGYCTYHQQIGELFPAIDIAMLGVGAYKPSFMMSDVHTSPSEAVQLAHDLKAKALIPMHYGTYDLADEPPSEPERLLTEMNEKGQIKPKLYQLKVGQMLAI
jgi:hypothetical protein